MVQMQSECVFCRILSGKLPSDILHHDDHCFVIRDIAPIAPVHLLVIPNRHYIHATAASQNMETTLGHLMLIAKEMAEREGIADSGYRMAINQGPNSGQSVDHLHLHVIGGRKLGREG